MYQKPKYTQTPNTLFDEQLSEMSCAEAKVVLAIIRKTFGWHQKSDKISISQLMEITGLSNRGVIDGLEKAMNRGIVNRERCGQSYRYWLVVGSCEESSQPGPSCEDTSQPPVRNPHTQKKHKESNSSNEQDKLAEMNRGFHPPNPTDKSSNTGEDKSQEQELGQLVESAAASDTPHQAIAHLRSFDETNKKNFYLSGLLLEMFGYGHERFGRENLHGRICGVKNKAKNISDNPYEWVVEKLFSLKGNDDFDPISEKGKQALPTRVHEYLQATLTKEQERQKIPEVKPGAQYTEEEFEKIMETGKYDEEHFHRFKVNQDSGEKAFIYKP